MPMQSGRRAFLKSAAGSGRAGPALPVVAGGRAGGRRPALRPGPPTIRPKAKNLIMIFLTGGFSHVDTFDYKPRSNHITASRFRRSGCDPTRPTTGRFWARRFDSGRRRVGSVDQRAVSPPGHVADELCVIRSLHTDIVEHFQAVLAMHTGSATVPLPSIGSWLSYGLGTFNANLPSYMVLCEHLPYAGTQVWDSSFLPPIQGVRIVPGPEPIPDLRPPARPVTLRSSNRSCFAT